MSAMIKIKKGLRLPITGEPNQTIQSGKEVKTVAVLGEDFVGLRPSMSVKVGDRVRCGDVLLTNKKSPGIKFTSPASGKVIAINRGEKRALVSVVISIDGTESVSFEKFKKSQLGRLKRDQVVDNLVESGLWTSFRTRPYSKIPDRDDVPSGIFVTAMDTNPLAADVNVVLEENREDFLGGLRLLTRLTKGTVFLCVSDKTNALVENVMGVERHVFAGPHPAGLVGTHIHFLHPVGAGRVVWHINYQDVIAAGKLFTTGQIHTERIVSLAGPGVSQPRLIRTRLGASLEELVDGELKDGMEHRVISGSVLSGRTAAGASRFLGRYHQQVSVLEEGRKREFLGWQGPGFHRFSVKNIFASKCFPSKKFAFTTSTEGSPRAMVPIGMYEKVMPLDIEPTFLLRALLSDDIAQAQLLGALELDEEDLALCSLVCPGKIVYGPLLRKSLTTIEEDG